MGLKEEFEKHADREKYQYDYEKDFLDFLADIVKDADAWIAREKANCSAPGKKVVRNISVKERILDMQEQSEKLLKEAEELAEKGDIEGSKQSTAASTSIKEDMKRLKEDNAVAAGGEMVCEICGVRCKPDEEADFNAHLDGKLHAGLKRIRATVNELRVKLKNGAPASKAKDSEKDDSNKRKRDDDEREGRRDRDRDRGQDRRSRSRRDRGRRDKRSR